MLSSGQLIWVSVRPLVRLAFCAAGGFAITKADILPPIAARGAGQIMLNLLLPCLLFSKMVPAFTSDNVSALGPLVLVGIVYELMGIIMAWVIRQFFWVPHRFRYGFLVAGGWGNYGDIPTSVIMSITGAQPFNPSKDQDVAVAYVSAFILVYMVTLFPMGGHLLIAKDFDGPDVEHEEVRDAVRRRRKYLLHGWPKDLVSLFRGRRKHIEDEKGAADVEPCSEVRSPPSKHVSFYDERATAEGLQSRFTSPAPTVTAVDGVWSAATTTHIPTAPPSLLPSSPMKEESEPRVSTPPPPKRWFHGPVWNYLKQAYKSFMTPASITIVVSLIIALVPKLKALFTPVEGTYMPTAPDGKPPLDFILDLAEFAGAASVPLALVCLGSALARMKLPPLKPIRAWKKLPLGSIASLAIGKMVMFPVLGILITKGLVQGGLIGKDDKVLQFVCAFFSCLPTATTQVYITQVYSGTGSADDLPIFLVPQYIIMFFSMTGLTAYMIQDLFSS